MHENSEIFIGLDVPKESHAVTERGRDGAVGTFGGIGSDAASVRRLVRKLARPGMRPLFCYEMGPTGQGPKRLLKSLGHDRALADPAPARREGENEPPRCRETGCGRTAPAC